MEWECHACGHQHPSIPAACERCGTAPEIMLNVWQCQHCGAAGIPSTKAACPDCGADRALGVQTAVSESLRMGGELGRKLAEGQWLYCAYCDVQVPPVNPQGQPNEVCPACKGPLSEAEREAAIEELSAEEAGQYRAEATAKRGEAAAPARAPAPAPRRRRRIWPFIVIPIVVVAVGFCSLVGYQMVKGPDQFQVAGRDWTCTVDVERFGPVQREDWRTAVPAGAYGQRCRRAIHHHDRIPAGTERYTDRVPSGRTCSSYGYRKRGGVSVKTCRSWKTTYRSVTKTRTRYRSVPVFRDKCAYTIDTWHTDRQLVERGSGEQEPRWPAVDGLTGKVRPGKRVGVYTLTLKAADDPETKRYTCKSLEEWKRFPVKSAVLAETSLAGEVTAIRTPEAK